MDDRPITRPRHLPRGETVLRGAAYVPPYARPRVPWAAFCYIAAGAFAGIAGLLALIILIGACAPHAL